MGGLCRRLPKSVMRMAKENAVITQAVCQLGHGTVEVAADIELGGPPLDDHIKRPGTHPRIEKIANDVIDNAAEPLKFWVVE